MSGITGLYYREGRMVDVEDLRRTVDVIAHRGPDGADAWCKGSVGLGHRMLWTTPESLHEMLPLVSESGDLAITADARIDNRQELWAALGNTGSVDTEVVDSELILASYQKWGEECPDRLLGDFAFAIWDARKQSLFCARDHFGVKPFYYALTDSVFAFGSEIKAILVLPDVPKKINEVRIAEHLASIADDSTNTFYDGILRLPSAHTLCVSRDKVSLKRYWSLDPERELKLGSDQEYAEALREIFFDAVRVRMRNNFPTGAMLSGGLDSSSITCVARQIMAEEGKGGKLSTFSAVYDDVKQSDERPYINAVLAQNGVKPSYFSADRTSPLVDFEKVLWHQDEPWSAGNLYINWSLLKTASEQGVRVVLDGFDGDTTVSHGTGYLIELARSNRWFTLAKELRAYSGHFQNTDWRKAFISWMWMYRLRGISERTPGFSAARSAIKPLLGKRRRGGANVRRQLIRPEFAEKVHLDERVQSLKRPAPQTEREEHYQRITWPLMPGVLEMMDKTAAGRWVEIRYPFWDKRMVEFCLSLPPEQKLHNGWNRMVMRRAMDGILPQEIQWRGGKGNLQYGFDNGLIKFEKELLDDVILGETGPISSYVDVQELRDSYKNFVSGHGTDNDMLSVWRAASLSVWLRSNGLSEKTLG
jgi:asparagine synthase (glutamine-hydrolysing)